MTGCRTDIDWSSKPEPWCWLGPQFRANCKRIANGKPPLPDWRRPSRRETEGLELRDRRLALGLTQLQLSNKAGYDAPQISEAELGRGWPTLISTIGQALTMLEQAAAKTAVER